MNKKVVVTLGISDKEKKFGYFTFPTFRKYAKKINADFIVLEKEKYGSCFEKFQIYNLLSKYERVLFVNPNVIINPWCPDLFNIVPKNKFGAFIESRIDNRDKEIKYFQKEYGSIKWKKAYFNTGVMLVSKEQKDIFNPKKLNKGINKGYESQSQINYNLQKFKISIYDIGLKFNHIDLKTKDDRFDSNIISYAGRKPHGPRSWLDQVKEDLKLIKILRITKMIIGFKAATKLVNFLSLLRNLTFKYEKSNCDYNKSFTRSLLNHFFLSLPHVIVSLFLILFFPLQWIGVILMGVLLPDISIGIGLLIYTFVRKKLDKPFKFRFNIDKISKINHYIIAILSLFFIFYGNYALGLAGLSHILLDWIGF